MVRRVYDISGGNAGEIASRIQCESTCDGMLATNTSSHSKYCFENKAMRLGGVFGVLVFMTCHK